MIFNLKQNRDKCCFPPACEIAYIRCPQSMYAKPGPHKHRHKRKHRQLWLCAKTQGWTNPMSRPQKPELCTCPARVAATHCAKHFPQQHIPAASTPAAHLFMSESTTGHHVDEAWEQKLKDLSEVSYLQLLFLPHWICLYNPLESSDIPYALSMDPLQMTCSHGYYSS